MTTPQPRVTPRLQKLFKEYASSHQTKGNQVTHYIGIPMIMLSLLGLLSLLVIWTNPTPGSLGDLLRLDGGMILFLGATFLYMYLDWKIAIPFAFVVLSFYFVGRSIPTGWLAAVFVVGWVIQLWGHIKYEKKRPSFMQNLVHVFVGPLWIFSKTIGYISAK
ncbi:MAG: DUF962 domain-containing protein [Bdellovibrionales bacterium]|nr:DUF962 domain-containing protein [Bdellovibrionales bacterium]